MPTLDLSSYEPSPGADLDAVQIANGFSHVQSTVNALDNSNIASGADIDLTTKAAAVYTTYIPSLTNGSVGNGTITSRYVQVGNLVHFYGRWTFGSTSAITGSLEISLPTNLASASALLGGGEGRDSSAGARSLLSAGAGGASARFQLIGQVAFNGGEFGVAATFPWTWATGDWLQWNLVYEAA